MRQLIVYGGTTQPSDTANTASANVERDSNGDSFVQGLAIGAIAAAAPTSGGSFLSLLGALLLAADTQSGTVSLTAANKCVQKLSASSGAFTLTLPAAFSSANLLYAFIKTDSSANVPTIKGAGTDSITVAGTTANTYAGLTAQGAHVTLWCDGTQWWQIA